MRGKVLAGSMLILALGVVGGCGESYDQGHDHDAASAVDVAAEAEAIRGRSAKWLEYAQAKDDASIANEMFMADATTIFDGKVHRGRAEIQAGGEKESAENPDSTITWTTSHVEVAVSGELAYERGSWTHDPDGDGEAAAENGEYLTIWKNVDGTWWCAVDSGTTIKAEEETAE